MRKKLPLETYFSWHVATTRNHDDVFGYITGVFTPKSKALMTKGMSIYDQKRGQQLYKRMLRTVLGL